MTVPSIPRCGEVRFGAEQFLDQIIQEILAGKLYGVQAYVSRYGTPLLNVGLGWASEGVAMTPENVVHWLCCTKPLIAILMAQLEERRTLDTSDPVAVYLPEFAVNTKADIDVRQLLNHTSGIIGDPAQEFLFCEWSRVVAAACHCEREPGWNPAERARYCDFTTWAVLAEIVRRLTGTPVAQRLEESIFAPLAMSDSHLGLSPIAWDSYGDRLSKMHFIGRQGRVECPFLNWREMGGYDWAGFGSRGPVRELAYVYESLLGVRRPSLLEAATVERFTRASRLRRYDEHLREAIEWGLGFMTDSPFWGMRSDVRVFGHTGLGSSFSLAVPDCGLVVAWASNCVAMPDEHRARIRRLMSALFGDLKLSGATT